MQCAAHHPGADRGAEDVRIGQSGLQPVALGLQVTHLATQFLAVGAEPGQQPVADRGGPEHHPECERQEDGSDGDHVVPQ